MIQETSKLGYGFIDINYTTLGKITPSVIMGDGSVRITTTYCPENCVSGIILSESPDNRGVGFSFIKDGVPRDPNEDPLWVNKNAKYQILFDNPASIEVMISRLQEAKRRLINPEWEDK